LRSLPPHPQALAMRALQTRPADRLSGHPHGLAAAVALSGVLAHATLAATFAAQRRFGFGDAGAAALLFSWGVGAPLLSKALLSEGPRKRD
jgi:hypothetical protein